MSASGRRRAAFRDGRLRAERSGDPDSMLIIANPDVCDCAVAVAVVTHFALPVARWISGRGSRWAESALRNMLRSSTRQPRRRARHARPRGSLRPTPQPCSGTRQNSFEQLFAPLRRCRNPSRSLCTRRRSEGSERRSRVELSRHVQRRVHRHPNRNTERLDLNEVGRAFP